MTHESHAKVNNDSNDSTKAETKNGWSYIEGVH